jgi:hypothetical protein
LGKYWKQDRRQDCNDCNHDEKFNQGERSIQSWTERFQIRGIQ